MYQLAGYCAALLLVGYLAVHDMKEKCIPAVAVLISGVLSVLYVINGENADGCSLMYCMMPGMVLLLLSVLTKESIGYGDGAAVLVLGFWTGGGFCAAAVSLGICMTGFYSAFMLLRGRKEPVPFMPFLLAAMEVMFACG